MISVIRRQGRVVGGDNARVGPSNIGLAKVITVAKKRTCSLHVLDFGDGNSPASPTSLPKEYRDDSEENY